MGFSWIARIQRRIMGFSWFSWIAWVERWIVGLTWFERLVRLVWVVWVIWVYWRCSGNDLQFVGHFGTSHSGRGIG
jgi:hypothetical protein